jgi:general secretion pathway protein A
MYTEYFGLKEKPFSIAPDPQYFFMSQGHREALAHLLYGIKSEGGFVLLTGEVGTGKTTVCRLLLELIPSNTETAFILNPKLTAEELLATVCDEFRIEYPPETTSIKVFVSLISDFLLKVHEKHRKAVLIIEEAQNLKPDVLEQIRLLTNLETNERKLLQIIMLGQPELRDILSKPELRQLSQRITARYHLGSLSKKEMFAYVNYRLSVAGLLRGHPFPRSALKPLFSLTKGVPRLINIILDRALLGAFAEGKDHVDRKTLITAAREVSGETKGPRNRLAFRAALVGFALLACVVALLASYYYSTGATGWSKAIFPGPFQARSAGIMASSNDGENHTTTTAIPLSNKDEAYSTLFSEWRIGYKPELNLTACEQAARQGLYCLEARGAMTNLRQIDKPVVLVFRNGGGDKKLYAALTALQGDKATLATGRDVRTIDVRQVEQTWTGEYLLIWRGPPKLDKSLKPGSRGPLVAWLDKQLAVVQGRPARVGPDQVYDEEIMKEVKELQRTTGLEADGIVGPKTVMQITAIAGKGGPVLQKKGAR